MGVEKNESLYTGIHTDQIQAFKLIPSQTGRKLKKGWPKNEKVWIGSVGSRDPFYKGILLKFY